MASVRKSSSSSGGDNASKTSASSPSASLRSSPDDDVSGGSSSAYPLTIASADDSYAGSAQDSARNSEETSTGGASVTHVSRRELISEQRVSTALRAAVGDQVAEPNLEDASAARQARLGVLVREFILHALFPLSLPVFLVMDGWRAACASARFLTFSAALGVGDSPTRTSRLPFSSLFSGPWARRRLDPLR